MIVPSMSYKEMYDNLAKDKNRVEYRKEYYLPKAIKEFKKTRIFPAWKWYNYTIPSTGNQYVVFFYAENILQIEKPTCDSFFVYYVNNKRFVIHWGATIIQTPNHPMEAVREIRAFTSHFFQRYKERFIKDNSLSSNDIACRFFSRNPDLIPIEINKNINNNIDNYDIKSNKGFRIKDGFCFTMSGVEKSVNKDKIDAIVTVFTTFVTVSTMSKNQREAIENVYWKTCLQLIENLEKESNNGTFEFVLQ